MSTVLAVMMAVLGAVGFLYYKKRKDGKVFQSILEPMTRAKSKSIIKKNSIAKKNSIHKNNSIVNKQVNILYLFTSMTLDVFNTSSLLLIN